MKQLILIMALLLPFNAMAEEYEMYNKHPAVQRAKAAMAKAEAEVKLAEREAELMRELMYTKGKLDQAEKLNEKLINKVSCQ